MSSPAPELETALQQLDTALQAEQLSATAAENIRCWLTEPRYRKYADQVAEHLSQGKWQALDDAFWTVIPFGTGGRRGRMYPIGSNAINDRTIGESAQGLAQYVREQAASGPELSCAIAYDTRHRSRHFAELCAGIMVAAGFKVYFLDDYRATPQLSYLVRQRNCSCGIMVTASHNPPSDNAVKVYWSTGGQVLPPHDRGIIDRVMSVEEIECTPFETALAEGQIVICTSEIDASYVAELKSLAVPGPRDIKIIYSPLHGVGNAAVTPVLQAAGFQDVEVFSPHATPDGDFPNVPGHVSNPENPAVFEAMIERAQETGAEMILATDPDCDRMGCAAPLSLQPGAPWKTLNGNQLAGLLADYVLQSRGGTVPGTGYMVTTLVTTELIRRVGESYGVSTYGELLVGFKWLCGKMDELGAENCLFAAEESHGYLTGHYARDKDGAMACLLMAEMAAVLKQQGLSLHEKLDALYWQHGCHHEQLMNVFMEGSAGMQRMQKLMAALRKSPPRQLAGLDVSRIRDYQHQTTRSLDGDAEPLDGPQDNLIVIELSEPGNYFAVRPSGTEPKVKFYMFAYRAPEMLSDLDTAKNELSDRLNAFENELKQFAADI